MPQERSEALTEGSIMSSLSPVLLARKQHAPIAGDSEEFTNDPNPDQTQTNGGPSSRNVTKPPHTEAPRPFRSAKAGMGSSSSSIIAHESRSPRDSDDIDVTLAGLEEYGRSDATLAGFEEYTRAAHTLSERLRSGAMNPVHRQPMSMTPSQALSQPLSVRRSGSFRRPRNSRNLARASCDTQGGWSEVLNVIATDSDRQMLQAEICTKFSLAGALFVFLLAMAHIVYILSRLHFMLYMNNHNQSGYNFTWSVIHLAADVLRFFINLLSMPTFWRQRTKFKPISAGMAQAIKQASRHYHHQHVHCMVVTYKEPVSTVRLCIQHLVDAPIPAYATRTIYLGDDGAALENGPAKARMCWEFRQLGHNVVYVGDRVKDPRQLNGKSSNLNHIILNKIYPNIKGPQDIPWSDLLMVMDCDHLVHVSFFQKVCAVMLDPLQAVCLVPQSFYNTIQPDFLDNANRLFMFGLLPYMFGLGVIFITGTNFMVRARPCFHACQKPEKDGVKPELWPSTDENQTARRQLFSEVLVAEDVDLGSRLHFLGYKATFIREELAWGEVPLPPREIWKQRNRWAKAGHLYILDKDSIFWKHSPHMSFLNKLWYAAPMVIQFCAFASEPIAIVTPPLCILADICPYGMSRSLWITHAAVMVSSVLMNCLPSNPQPWRFVYGQISSRVQLLVGMKAVVNTVLVKTGLKKPNKFKTSAKQGTKDSQGGPVTAVGSSATKQQTSSWRDVLPYDGTIDFWVILVICFVSLAAAAVGVIGVAKDGELAVITASARNNLQLVSVVFSLWEALPGVVFLMYCACYKRAPWVLMLWAPTMCTLMVLMIVAIEVRLGWQYLSGPWDYFFGYNRVYA